MAKAKQAIAKKDEGGLVLSDKPDFLKEGGNRGNEDVTSNDITLPRLQIIQDLSPQHKEKKEQYIEGAKVGDFFNTVSNQLYKSIKFVPVHFETEYVIWKDQDSGGGFFGAFPTEAEAVKAFPDAVKQGGGTKEEYEITLTNVHYILIIDEENSLDGHPAVEQAVISMSKSQNKVSRTFNTMVRMGGGDRFSRVYSLDTVDDENKAGQEYVNWRIKPVGFVSEALYRLGEECYESIKAGRRKVDYGNTGGQTEAGEPQSDGDIEDEFDI